MTTAATQILAMGVDVPILLWIGGVLLLIGLFFALVGRRPARRDLPSNGRVDAIAPGDRPDESTATP